MSSEEVTTLGSVVKCFDSKRIPLSARERKSKQGHYPYYGAAGIIDNVNEPIFSGQYLLMGEDGSVIKEDGTPVLQLVSGEFWVNNHAHVLQGETDLDTRFLYYALSNTNIQGFVTGAVQPKLNQANMNKIPVYYPGKSIRKQIVEKLSSLDDKIELNRQTNATLEAIAQAIFKEWFVDFNYPGATGELVESELGMIPKGWRVGKLEEMFDFLEGPGIRNWQYTNEGIPFVNIRLIENNDINILKANFVSTNEALIKYPHFLLAEKDMIVSTSGTLGKTAIVRKSHLPLLLNTSVIRFKPTDGFSYPFMYQFLQSFRFLSELVSLASGSVQLNFGPSHLKRINIVIPPREIVLEYCNQISEVYSIIDTNLEEIISLASIRDSLLPKLMNGDMEI